MANREVQMFFRATATERSLVEERARERGMGISPYIRAVMMYGVGSRRFSCEKCNAEFSLRDGNQLMCCPSCKSGGPFVQKV